MTTTLPGQAAVALGPIDLTTMYLLHHGFRRDLARFSAAAHRTPYDDTATWQAQLRRWDLFADLLEDHHRKEDDHVWPLVRSTSRGAAPVLAVLEEMETEHERIDPLLLAVREALARLALGPDPTGRERLQELLSGLREVLGHHLGHEERAALPLLQRHVPLEQWQELDRRALRGGASLRQLLTLVPWLVHGLPAATVAEPLRAAGWPMRLLLRLGRGRFARLEDAAFTHVPAGVGA